MLVELWRETKMNFQGKSVIITGASGGIGSETARMFAEKGADIVVNYFSSPEKAEKAEKTLKTVCELGVVAFSFKADVSNPKEVSLMIKETIDRFGRIDLLVNNAATHPPPFFDFEKPDWDFWKKDDVCQCNGHSCMLSFRCIIPKENWGKYS
jgi:3-oxoacyl-[acyl-carrier protein] reductase